MSLNIFHATRDSRRLLILILCLSGLITFVSLSASARRLIGRTPGLTPSTLQGAPEQEKFPVAVIAIGRFGFEPAEIILPNQRCFLVVRNRTGLEPVTLEITRKAGGKIITERHSKSKKHWEKMLDLTPGDYLLTVAEMPDWKCKITVSPNKN